MTYALGALSPAINGGNGIFSPYTDFLTDQRLYLRDATDDKIDIGAYEVGAGASADLAITKTVSQASVVIGTPFSYTITVTNRGPSQATGLLQISDTLPAGVTLNSWWASQGTCAGTAPVICTLGVLNPTTYSAATVILNVTAPGTAGLISNTATVTPGNEPDPDLTNNSATVNTTLISPPGAFGKSAPASGATGQSLTPQLSWGTASGAVTYEYCYDTTNDSACGGTWTSTAGTSVTLGALTSNTTYYWQVRAVNPDGTTQADGGTWWSFTTLLVPPAAFGKTAPASGATGQSLTPQLSWGTASGAVTYEYCYDTTNDNALRRHLDQHRRHQRHPRGFDLQHHLLLAGPGRQPRRHHPGRRRHLVELHHPARPPGCFRQDRPGQRRHRPVPDAPAQLGDRQRGRHLRILL